MTDLYNVSDFTEQVMAEYLPIIIGCGVKFVSDITLQRADIDLVDDRGNTYSIKHQQQYYKYFNFVLEEQAYDRKARKWVDSWLVKGKSDYTIFVCNHREDGYTFHIYPTSIVKKTMTMGTSRRGLTKGEREYDRSQGRKRSNNRLITVNTKDLYELGGVCEEFHIPSYLISTHYQSYKDKGLLNKTITNHFRESDYEDSQIMDYEFSTMDDVMSKMSELPLPTPERVLHPAFTINTFINVLKTKYGLQVTDVDQDKKHCKVNTYNNQLISKWNEALAPNGWSVSHK